MVPQIFERQPNKPIRFFLHESIRRESKRSKLKRKITENGGKILDTATGADTVLVDQPQAEARLLQMTYSASGDPNLRRILVEPSEFVKDCIAKGRFARTVVPDSRLRRRTRVEFTEEDKNNLIQILARISPDGTANGRKSKTLYRELMAAAEKSVELEWLTRHTAQSWHEHYRNNQRTFDKAIKKHRAKYEGSRGALYPFDHLDQIKKMRASTPSDVDSEELSLSEEDDFVDDSSSFESLRPPKSVRTDMGLSHAEGGFEQETLIPSPGITSNGFYQPKASSGGGGGGGWNNRGEIPRQSSSVGSESRPTSTGQRKAARRPRGPIQPPSSFPSGECFCASLQIAGMTLFSSEPGLGREKSLEWGIVKRGPVKQVADSEQSKYGLRLFLADQSSGFYSHAPSEAGGGSFVEELDERERASAAFSFSIPTDTMETNPSHPWSLIGPSSPIPLSLGTVPEVTTQLEFPPPWSPSSPCASKQPQMPSVCNLDQELRVSVDSARLGTPFQGSKGRAGLRKSPLDHILTEDSPYTPPSGTRAAAMLALQGRLM